jgi:hypothetical protein
MLARDFETAFVVDLMFVNFVLVVEKADFESETQLFPLLVVEWDLIGTVLELLKSETLDAVFIKLVIKVVVSILFVDLPF